METKVGGASGRRAPIFGAEPWRDVTGHTWSWWDLWCCVLAVADHDGDLAGLDALFVEKLRALGNLHGRDGNEAKLSHIRDLTDRLAAARLTPADLATPEVSADRAVTRRARDKVLKTSSVEYRARTPAMIDTPRHVWSRRARKGFWSAFPSDPQPFFDLFAPVGDGHDFVSERRSFGVARRLGERLGEVDVPDMAPADRLALYRGFHTATLEVADDADDSCGVIGEVRREAWETYVRIDWRATGIDTQAYWEDLCGLAIWEPYAIDFQAEELWFASAVAEDVDVIEAVLVGRESELRAAVLDSEADDALERLAQMYAATGTLERCRDAAERLGSRAWRPIVTMARALLERGDLPGAIAVFEAADQPGWHRDELRRRCAEMTGTTLG